MSTFDILLDAPGLLRAESLDITLSFTQHDSIGVINWNIPTPAAGCQAGSQAYNGMIITIGTKPSGPPIFPKDGEFYTADPTADPKLFAGDKIGDAFVIGTFYKDLTTTTMTVSGLIPNTSYYITGYPVDAEYRYYIEGVHSYSQKYTTGAGKPGMHGWQQVKLINDIDDAYYNADFAADFYVEGRMSGLQPQIQYQFQIQIGLNPPPTQRIVPYECKPSLPTYTINVDGSKAVLFTDLVNEINKQLSLLDNPYRGPSAPNTGTLYWDGKSFYTWNGTTDVPTTVIIEPNDPTNVVVGSYWFNGIDLKQFSGTGTWDTLLYMTADYNPTQPTTDISYWYDTVNHQAYKWSGVNWCSIETIISLTDPSLMPTITPGSYWYDSSTNSMYSWDSAFGMWINSTALKSPVDPANLPEGFYWFNTKTKKLYIKDIPTMGWNQVIQFTNSSTSPINTPSTTTDNIWTDPVSKVVYVWDALSSRWYIQGSATSIDLPTNPTNNTTWYDQSTQTVYLWDATNTRWYIQGQTNVNLPTVTINNNTVWYNSATQEVNVWDQGGACWYVIGSMSCDVDPLQRHSCDLWWDTTNDTLHSWDIVNDVWHQVVQFFIQDNDPTVPPTISYNALWYNPATQVSEAWLPNCFKKVDVINYPSDPSKLTVGEYWYDIANNVWNQWNGTTWVQIYPILSSVDPLLLPIGTLWYDPNMLLLQMWNGMGWITISYHNNPPTPAKGTLWYNTVTDSLVSWDGLKWIPAKPKATVALDCKGNLLFEDTEVGSLSFIQVQDISLFKSLSVGFRYGEPHVGADEVSNEPSWNELGVGTDGNNDARLKLANEIRYSLGYPVVDVELTHEQLDYAITTALSELRAKSGIGYKNGYFFLRTHPETSKYLLTNKTSGSNKVVDILSIQKVNSLASGGHDSGIYGQIFANFLYNAGNFDLLSYHLMTEYKKTYEILFAQRIQWNWNEHTRELNLHQRMPYDQILAIECTIERTEQDIMSDRFCVPWIRRYATALSRIMLAEIRGKYASLPGAGGGITLNANDLRIAATEALTQCLEEIDNYLMDNPQEWGMSSSMHMG